MQHKTVLLTVKRIQNAAYILLVRLWVLGVKIAPFGREQGAFKNVGGFHPLFVEIKSYARCEMSGTRPKNNIRV